jgi:CubicO group peptidase (beta-lactamase class C family)
MRRIAVLLAAAACGGSPRVAPVAAPPPAPTPHKAAVTAQIQPLIDNEIASAMVIGLYDHGKTEVYGFGKGPGGAPPTETTLFEIGSVTKVYTSLLLADAVQRREVALDQPVAELLPTGVSVPTRDGKVITLAHLALHSSGLPRLPPSILPKSPDPYAKLDENGLYADLAHTTLDSAPGDQIAYSNYGTGLLGFALGKKLGTNYPRALADRVLGPLGLTDTFFAVPAAAAARRAVGTNTDLQPVPPWTHDALAAAGALISDAHDQLKLIDAELAAAAAPKDTSGLRPAMRLTQEAQLVRQGDNEGLGWQIDGQGRYWHNGGTGGFHAFVSFDPKTHRGIVILAATSTMTVDRLVDVLYRVFDGSAPPPPTYPTATDFAPLIGHYDFQGMKIAVTLKGKRLYVEGPGESPLRLVPLSAREFWIEQLQSMAAFDEVEGKIARVVFQIGDHQLAAPRID